MSAHDAQKTATIRGGLLSCSGKGNMSTTTLCASCTAPLTGAAVCPGCIERLTSDLGTVGELCDDMLITRTKQDTISSGQPSVSGTPQRPLGYRPGALDAAARLDYVLRYWGAMIAIEVGDHAEPGITSPVIALWLARHPSYISQHKRAHELIAEITHAIARCRRVIDRPPEREYAGPCHCGADLYARERAEEIVCRNCRTTYKMVDRRAWIMESLREHLATAAEIANGVGEVAGKQLRRNTITQWHVRGRLFPAGYAPTGEPMYRIGDVLDLAAPAARSS